MKVHESKFQKVKTCLQELQQAQREYIKAVQQYAGDMLKENRLKSRKSMRLSDVKWSTIQKVQKGEGYPVYNHNYQMIGFAAQWCGDANDAGIRFYPL